MTTSNAIDCGGTMCTQRNCVSCYLPEQQLELPLGTPKGQPDATGYIWGCGHDCRDLECTGCKVVGYASPKQTDPVPEQPLPENPKAIYGRAKPSLALMPGAAMIEESFVYALGAAKYGPFNWRKDPVESMTYAHAALRHLFSWIDGEDRDPESGRSHLAHARACLGIVLDAAANGKLIDDRPYAGVSSRLIAENTKPVNL